FTQFAIADCSVNVIIRILSEALPAMLCVVKFNIFFFDTKKIQLKQMLEEIINNRRMLTDPQEIKIVEHYARQGKIATIMSICNNVIFMYKEYYSIVEAYIIQLYYICDIKYSLIYNLLRSRLVCCNYFTLKMEKITIIWHILYNLVLTIFSVFAFLIMALIPDILDFFRPLNESRAHYISFLNEYHMNKGIQFYYCLLYSVISINIGVLSVLSISSMLLLISLHCCALFKVCSYRIQHSVDKKVIACSNKRNVIVERLIRTVELHQNAQKYMSLWYKTPVSVQKFFLFIMQICSKSVVPNIAGLLVLVMETFTSVRQCKWRMR
ncbi:uncharacterized protein, partial [Temnothorax nylanderi]|uniref:uncharacterized protein n=1 Tax=Temnothorax nylanderi TaxID=102681 RepID=UPI003A83ECCB